MLFRPLRLRFRRRFKKGQRQVEEFGAQTEKSIETHIFRRFSRLRPVRRFVISWLLLIVLVIGGVLIQTVLLSGYFQTYRPVPGGIYSEGVLGRFTTANPLFASGAVDTTVSHLVFNGLFGYDVQNKLAPELASDYSVDTKGTVYTVHLKPHLRWQDGKPLTAADVVFTYHTIQNPDVRSPLLSSWQGIAITATDASTIVFKLPGVLASFPYNLTTGIVPKHLLGSVTPADLRSADFNTVQPIGSGAFAWHTIQVTGNDPNTQQEQIALLPFAGYQAGKPKLQEFIVRAYANQHKLISDLQAHQLTAAEGFNNLPKELAHNTSLSQHSLLLTAANMIFFKTSTGTLSDPSVRQALSRTTNVPAITASLSYPTHEVREPLLQGQLAYDPTAVQAAFNLNAAAQLDKAGWLIGKTGLRYKDGKPLRIILTASDSPEYRTVCQLLKQQWGRAGVDLRIQLQDSTNFQSTLSSHSYEALLYGISIGVDPDVFVYWDSSQADIRSTNRLNLSEYKNTVADSALESGRTRLDPALRTIKYKPFLQAWQQDVPAIGLYQPRVLYVTSIAVAGFSDHAVNNAAERFYNIQNWQIRQAKVTNP
jgi:peptide/nickel transport system substrate-binding protein